MLSLYLQNWKPTLLTGFFEYYFGKNRLHSRSPEPPGAMFHSLYDASVTLAGFAYRVLFMLVLYACVITLLLHVAKYVMSMSVKDATEAKQKITRVFIVALCCGMLASVVAIIVKAFAV